MLSPTGNAPADGALSPLIPIPRGEPAMALETDLLRHVAIFQLLDDDELTELSSHIDQKIFAAGQTIFRAGEAGGEMYVVLSGQVQTYIRDEDGRQVVLADVGPGEWFGELSLLDGDQRSATAVAVSQTRTCIIDREDLHLLFAKKPDAALDVLAILSRRLRDTDQIIAQRASRYPNVIIEARATWGDRIADAVARFGGSWAFINSFGVVMLVWMGINTWSWLTPKPFDPPPYIGLNLVLSMLAALQAPVIMMSQNRQDAKDRVRADIEYEVNVRAEQEITDLQKKVEKMKEDLLEAILMKGPVH